VAVGKQPPAQVQPDEAGAAGNQNAHQYRVGMQYLELDRSKGQHRSLAFNFGRCPNYLPHLGIVDLTAGVISPTAASPTA
jgi:hypothetical protein